MPDGLLVCDAVVVNADGRPPGLVDIEVDGGAIGRIGPSLPRAGKTVVDAKGAYVLPGLVDPHVHVSGRFGTAAGFRMMVRAGVTTCLDMAGEPASLLSSLRTDGCGMTVGVLYPLVPGDTVAGRDPSRSEIHEQLERQAAAGAFGLKVLGGHYPLTPEATARTIEVCAEFGVHCGIHAGTTATGSNIEGLEELVGLSAGRRFQAAHINAYCRGQVTDPVEEAGRAIAALRKIPASPSESYLAIINGAEAACVDGVPLSNVVKTCLRKGGYPVTEQGMIDAITAGWARIQAEKDGMVVLVGPSEGLELFRSRETKVGVSFPVNQPAAALALALARGGDGRRFAVDAFSTDGGSIPRNTTLRQAMGLVAAGLLTLEDLVLKGSLAGARMLGLAAKGRIHAGADADMTVVGGDGDAAVTIAGGRVVYDHGRFPARDGGRVFCRPEGAAAVKAAGVGYVRTETIATRA
ncbi:MAG TPA: amidohydrolase family protein [bacterium]|nr:amidohydrolase family protein [bacterium]